MGWFVVLTLLLATAWLAREHSLARRQERTLPALYAQGALVMLEEPTALGQLVAKFAPGSRESLRDRIGARWLERTTVLLVDRLSDERSSRVAELVAQLGTVREIHLREPRLSAGGRLELSRRLPGVNLASSSVPAEQKHYRSRTAGAQFAAGGALLASLFAVGLPCMLLWAGWSVVRLLRPKPDVA